MSVITRAGVLALILSLLLVTIVSFNPKQTTRRTAPLRVGNNNNNGDELPESTREMGFPLNLLGLKASPYLDGTLAGDAGFDPLLLSKSREQLFFAREAEIKHARIAMLGALGWPVSELYHGIIASRLGLENLLQDGRVPSVLNGGLENAVFLASLGGLFTVGGILELELIRRKKETPESLDNFFNMWRDEDWEVPGNYQFDPLNLGRTLCGDSPQRKLMLQSIEIFNGRTSMLACTGFVVQEAFTGEPVVKETPQFFSFCYALWDNYCATNF